jgi:hypothetical protein
MESNREEESRTTLDDDQDALGMLGFLGGAVEESKLASQDRAILLPPCRLHAQAMSNANYCACLIPTCGAFAIRSEDSESCSLGLDAKPL